MTVHGIILFELLGLTLLLLIVDLVRTKRLFVGYAVVWFLSILAPMFIMAVPQLLYLLPQLVGAVFPASAFSLLAFVFIFLVLVFFSMQLSTISARQAELIQALALQELLANDEQGKAAVVERP